MADTGFNGLFGNIFPLFGPNSPKAEERRFEALRFAQIDAERRAEAQRQIQRGEQIGGLNDALSPFGAATAKELGGQFLAGGSAATQAAATLSDLQQRRANQEPFAETRGDIDRNRQFEIDSQALTLQNQRLTHDINQLSLAEAQRVQAQAGLALQPRMAVPVIQLGSGTVQPTLVDTPTSPAFHVRKNNMKQVLRGAQDLERLGDSLSPAPLRGADKFGRQPGENTGVEFSGPVAGEQRALWGTSILAFAKSKEMGALQAPDERIARTVIPNPTSIGANVSATLRGTMGLADAGLGFFTGQEGGFFGLSSADQIAGMQRQYEVATKEMYASVIAEIVSNPLLLDEFTDADLRQIPPDLLAPISPYLQAARRDPYGQNN